MTPTNDAKSRARFEAWSLAEFACIDECLYVVWKARDAETATLRENIRLLLENDGGEGSKRYDATAFLTARDALRGWLTEQPEPSTTIPNYGDPKLAASISLRHKLNKAADAVSPFSNPNYRTHVDSENDGAHQGDQS